MAEFLYFNFFWIVILPPGYIKTVEVINVANKKSQAGTNIQKVRQQNQQSANQQQQANQQFEAEFASETDAQSVKQKNQQSQARKQQNQQ